MTRPRPTPPPAWFMLSLFAAWAALCHVRELRTLDHPHVQQAFWGFLVWIGEIIWQGLEGAAKITLAIVAASVQQLWAFARSVFNTAVDLGKITAIGFKDAWGFLQKLYDDILKPAWLKFWALVDRVRGVLDRALRPVFDFLRAVRRELLDLYAHWIRPVLDTIDTVRKVLQVLAALHLKFAQQLDAQLARLEDLIDAPFRYALGKINEVINFVNRIATADGLFQRLALIRSIERDIAYVHREFLNAWHHPLTDNQRADAKTAWRASPVDTVSSDARDYFTTRGGATAAIIDEQIDQGRIYFRPR